MKEITQDIEKLFYDSEWHDSANAVLYGPLETTGEKAARIGGQIKIRVVPSLAALSIGVASCASQSEKEVGVPAPIVEKRPTGMPSQQVFPTPTEVRLPPTEASPTEVPPTEVLLQPPTEVPSTQTKETMPTPTIESFTLPELISFRPPTVEQLGIGGEAASRVVTINERDVEIFGPTRDFLGTGEEGNRSQTMMLYYENNGKPLFWGMAVVPVETYLGRDWMNVERLTARQPLETSEGVIRFEAKDGTSRNFVLQQGARPDGAMPFLIFNPETAETEIAWWRDGRIVSFESPFVDAPFGQGVRIAQKVEGNLIQEVVERYDLSTRATKEEVKVIWSLEKAPEVKVPEIEGLRAVREGNKIIYRAEAGNPYGLEVGAYGGEIYSNVILEGRETKGIVLRAPIGEKVINAKLAKISNQRDKWLVALAIDPRGLDQVSLDFKKGYGDHQIPIVTISFSGQAPVINVIPDTTSLVVIKNNYYGQICIDSMRFVDPYTDKVAPGKEMQYITIAGRLIGRPNNAQFGSRFGDKIASAEDSINISVGAAQEQLNLTAEKIFSIQGLPVFVAVN